MVRTSLSFVLLSALTAVAAAEPVRLAHRFTVGQEILVEAQHEAELKITKNEEQTEVTHATDSQRRYVVESIDATGAATVVSSVTSVNMSASSPDGAWSYDSTTGAKPPEQFAGVAETVGKPLARFVVTPTGSVELVTPLLKGVVNASADSQAYEHPFVRLPDQPVSVGDEWSESFKKVIMIPKQNPEAVNMKRVYRLESFDGSRATIRWRSVVLTPIRDSRIEGELAQHKLDGSLEFDVKAGRMISREAAADADVVGFSGGGSLLESHVERSEKVITKVASR